MTTLSLALAGWWSGTVAPLVPGGAALAVLGVLAKIGEWLTGRDDL